MLEALRSGAPEGEGRPGVEVTEAEAPGRGRTLICRTCGRPITTSAHRTEVSGSHAHTFCNPAGLVYELGCFDAAPGAGTVGPAEHFFSWFPGYAWRVAVCRGCTTHLGWSYGDDDFWGLIFERLAEQDEDE